MPDSKLRLAVRAVHSTAATLLWTLLSAVLLLALWEISVRFFHVQAYVLPQPYAVWKALVAGLMVDPTSRGSFWYHLFDTMHATILGFVIATVAGIALAAVMAEFRLAQRLLFPYVVCLQSLPKVAIAPLFVIWFGYQIESKIAMAATITLFPILLNSLEGFATVERERLHLMSSLGASRWQVFRLIKVPSALPFIFAGLNLGIVYALLGAIVAEFLGAQRGVGVIISQLQAVSDTAGVFAVLVLLVICSFLLISLMRLAQRRVVFWAGSTQRSDTV